MLLNYAKASPDAYGAMLKLSNFAKECGIERSLLDLVQLRASQINGCAFCIDMHAKDARAAGEKSERLDTLSAWRETPFFTPRERAALAWTEAVTRLADGPVPEALFDDLRPHFSDKEIVDLTIAIVAINGWNRLAAPFRSEPGRYQPKAAKSA
jgi:AhpD family alkylhydroperoxidase